MRITKSFVLLKYFTLKQYMHDIIKSALLVSEMFCCFCVMDVSASARSAKRADLQNDSHPSLCWDSSRTGM